MQEKQIVNKLCQNDQLESETQILISMTDALLASVHIHITDTVRRDNKLIMFIRCKHGTKAYLAYNDRSFTDCLSSFKLDSRKLVASKLEIVKLVIL